MNVKKILMPAAALLMICLVATALLAATYSITADKIDQNAVQAENEARSAVFPQAASFSEIKKIDGKEYCEALDGSGNCIGYTFTTTDKGYGGDVIVMTGVRTDGTVNGVEILDVSNETPGLGQNAKNGTFAKKYIGKSGEIGVNTAGKAVPNGIDALTGATFTSRGVTNAVNQALKLYEQITKGGAANG